MYHDFLKEVYLYFFKRRWTDIVLTAWCVGTSKTFITIVKKLVLLSLSPYGGFDPPWQDNGSPIMFFGVPSPLWGVFRYAHSEKWTIFTYRVVKKITEIFQECSKIFSAPCTLNKTMKGSRSGDFTLVSCSIVLYSYVCTGCKKGGMSLMQVM